MQNIQGPFSHCFEDINIGKGESASVAPGLGVEVFGGWCPNLGVLANHLGSLLERVLSGPHPRNRFGKTAVGVQESPLELTVVLILMSSDPILRKYWFRQCEGKSILTLERKLKTISHQIRLRITTRRTKHCLF